MRSQVHYIGTGGEFHRTVSHLPRSANIWTNKIILSWVADILETLPGIVANNTTFCYSYKYDKICCKSYWSIQFISSSNAVYKCRKMHYCIQLTRNKNFTFSINEVINECCYISFVCLMTSPLPLYKSKLLCSPLKGVANFCLFSQKAVICSKLK